MFLSIELELKSNRDMLYNRISEFGTEHQEHQGGREEFRHAADSSIG